MHAKHPHVRTAVLVSALISVLPWAPTEAQEPVRAGDGASSTETRPLVERGLLVTVGAAIPWVVLARPAAAWAHESLGLARGDDGDLNGWVATSPALASAGAALAAWAVGGTGQGPGALLASASAGAYGLPLALAYIGEAVDGLAGPESGDLFRHGAAVTFLGAPVGAALAALALPATGAEVRLGAGLLQAPEHRSGGLRTGPLPTIRGPALPALVHVGGAWRGGLGALGFEVGAFVVETRYEGRQLHARRAAATHVLATASRTVMRIHGWTMDGELGLGGTGYHGDDTDLAMAAGLDLGPDRSRAPRLRLRVLMLGPITAAELGLGVRWRTRPR